MIRLLPYCFVSVADSLQATTWLVSQGKCNINLVWNLFLGDVDCIAYVSGILTVAIFKAKWLPNGACTYFKSQSTGRWELQIWSSGPFWHYPRIKQPQLTPVYFISLSPRPQVSPAHGFPPWLHLPCRVLTVPDNRPGLSFSPFKNRADL
jgi:hypothetical protein